MVAKIWPINKVWTKGNPMIKITCLRKNIQTRTIKIELTWHMEKNPRSNINFYFPSISLQIQRIKVHFKCGLNIQTTLNMMKTHVTAKDQYRALVKERTHHIWWIEDDP